MNARNIFDTDPPVYITPSEGSYDTSNADLLGRFVGVSVRKTW
jgi:outer membrane receptor protein involved in Fe transport